MCLLLSCFFNIHFTTCQILTLLGCSSVLVGSTRHWGREAWKWKVTPILQLTFCLSVYSPRRLASWMFKGLCPPEPWSTCSLPKPSWASSTLASSPACPFSTSQSGPGHGEPSGCCEQVLLCPTFLGRWLHARTATPVWTLAFNGQISAIFIGVL